jgi:hypothetical protein
VRHPGRRADVRNAAFFLKTRRGANPTKHGFPNFVTYLYKCL